MKKFVITKNNEIKNSELTVYPDQNKTTSSKLVKPEVFLYNSEQKTITPLAEEYQADSLEKFIHNELGYKPIFLFSSLLSKEEKEEKARKEQKISFPFLDIDHHPAAVHIEELQKKGCVKGRKLGVFAPDEFVTRSEFTKVVLCNFDIELLPHPKEKPFQDFQSLDSWDIPYVYTAKKIGLIHGYPDKTFRSNNPILRVEALKIILQAAQQNINQAKLIYFSDIEKNAWYGKYVSFGIENNIISAYPDNTFRPTSRITRGEMATIMHKARNMVKNYN